MEEDLTGVFDNTFHIKVDAFSSVLTRKRIQKSSLGLKTLLHVTVTLNYFYLLHMEQLDVR